MGGDLPITPHDDPMPAQFIALLVMINRYIFDTPPPSIVCHVIFLFGFELFAPHPLCSHTTLPFPSFPPLPSPLPSIQHPTALRGHRDPNILK